MDVSVFRREPPKRVHKYTPLLPNHREACEGIIITNIIIIIITIKYYHASVMSNTINHDYIIGGMIYCLVYIYIIPIIYIYYNNYYFLLQKHNMTA